MANKSRVEKCNEVQPKPNPRCPVCGVPMERTERGALRCGQEIHELFRNAGAIYFPIIESPSCLRLIKVYPSLDHFDWIHHMRVAGAAEHEVENVFNDLVHAHCDYMMHPFNAGDSKR